MEEYKIIRTSGFLMGVKMGSEKDHINLIHQRYHLLQWEKANPNTKIEDIETILEIGGGYGALAIVASRLGFVGDYHIIDLPVFEEYQRQHLDFRGVNCTMKWDKISRPDLMIAIASLSEIPVKSRTKFLYDVRPRSYLTAYAEWWDDVNNTEYFTDWAEQQGLDSITYGDRHQLQYLISTEGTQ
jgi:hypothetical protein